jgi:hypothetical protein
VFVSNDVGFFKVDATDLTVTLFQELMTAVEFIHVSHDTMYFLTKINYTVLSYVFALANTKYEVLSVSVDTLVTIMRNLVQFSDEIKAFCKDQVNICMFHITYNFIRGVVMQQNACLHLQNQQTIPSLNIEVPSMEVPKDDALTIDELIAQWDTTSDSFDPIDEILMDLSSEDIAYANTIIDDVDMVMDTLFEV